MIREDGPASPGQTCYKLRDEIETRTLWRPTWISCCWHTAVRLGPVRPRVLLNPNGEIDV